MNTLQMAQDVYASSINITHSDRSIEHAAFSKITGRIASASANGKAGFHDLVTALHENQRLWTLIAAEVASPENELPQDLRAQIFYLAEFTSVHTRQVLRQDATADALVDVNTAVMRGLNSHQGAS
ncbi:flagellar biosynthesis regulator FlaF [Thalassobium sp. R2A62]|uniref:flagellar biosynthesis regulator FlaF n=1 Tax=Thalassobium sp. R2A62 TaxID=633131 RepID=UPI000303EE04|nr:flagellar biosynthesis regulator FlaF [Thalassobium sp. R2A62]